MRDSPRPLFFLGDAADISCTSEFEHFLRVMRVASSRSDGTPMPWFLALGNHDGFYEGNIVRHPVHPKYRASPKENEKPWAKPTSDPIWPEACFADDRSLPKESLAPDPAQSRPSTGRLLEFERKLLIQSQNSNETFFMQRSLAKATAILLYLDDLRGRGMLDSDPLDEDNWDRDDITNEHNEVQHVLRYVSTSHYSFSGKSLSFQVVASITPSANNAVDDIEWRGYLAQDVEMPSGTHAVLIDTSDATNTPFSKVWNEVPTGVRQLFVGCEHETDHAVLGECARVSSTQVADITTRPPKTPVATPNERKPKYDKFRGFQASWAPGTPFVVMGHHHLASLGDVSRNALATLIGQDGFVAYFSAHTHYSAARAPVANRHRWEVNIGSLTDAPVRYVLVSLAGKESTLDVDQVRPTPKASCPYADLDNELNYEGISKYLTRSLVVYGRILEIAMKDKPLATELEATPDAVTFGCAGHCLPFFASRVKKGVSAPTNAQRLLLAELIEFDREVLQSSAQMRDVEMSCSLWASEGEYERTHKGAPTLIPNGQVLDTDPLPGSHAPFSLLAP